MAKFKDTKFRLDKVIIDNNEFDNCTFIECILEFKGEGNLGMRNCNFVNSKWVFSGAAGKTIGFLKVMYDGMGEGGQEIVEATFQAIKGGSMTKNSILPKGDEPTSV